MREKTILLLILLLCQQTAQEIRDVSFRNYCTRIGGQLMQQQISDGNASPVGDQCKVKLALPARDNEEARDHCTRWGVHVVRSGRKEGGQAECVFENVYQCKSDFTQIRGMCYKVINYELKTYDEAKELCEKLDTGVVLLKMSDIHLGELFEDQFDHLTMYFVQPDKEYEEWVTFAGGEGPNYVVLFNDAHFYGAGANSIMKFKNDKKANVICMYRPQENILSFSVKAEKLGSLYYPTLVSGVIAVWRTTGLYTPTTVPNHDVCQKSMAAILGTDDGTLFNLDPKYTALLTNKVRESFTYAYGPFVVCRYVDRYSDVYRVYFKSRETPVSQSCQNSHNIPEDAYKASWNKRDAYDHNWSFLYFPYTTGGYDFQSKKNAIYGPMLCGITFNADSQRADDCPDGWYLYERSSGFICHRYFDGFWNFADAHSKCGNEGAEMSKWRSEDELHFLMTIRSQRSCEQNHCDAWVKCTSRSGCTDDEYGYHHRDGYGYGDLHPNDLSTAKEDYLQSVMCEQPGKK